MSSIYPNGIYWYYQTSIIVDGRRKKVVKSLKTKSEKIAKKRKKLFDEKYDDLRNPFASSKKLLSKAIQEYIEHREKRVKRFDRSPRTIDSDKGALKLFLKYINSKYGDTYLNEIRIKDIEDFKETRLDVDGVSLTTIGINLRHTRTFFEYFKKKGIIENNPFRDVEIPEGERREIVPLEKDWEKIFNYLEKESQSKEYNWFTALLWIMVNTGMRMGEIRILKWQRGQNDYGRKLSKNYVFLDQNKNTITIYFKKGLRTIPIDHISDIFQKIPKTTTIYKYLRKKKKEVQHVYVFENPHTKNPRDHPDMTRTFKELMKKLKLNTKYTPHSLRHGFVSDLANKGENLLDISRIVGHSLREITEFIYAHHSAENLRNTMSKINPSNC